MTVLYGVAAVAVLWWFLSNFAHANTAALAKVLKGIVVVVALGAAGLLAFRGRIDLAVMLAALAAGFLGWGGLRFPAFGGRSTPAPGSASRVRSSLIEMELDHDTGEMDGTVIAGAFVGKRLNALDELSLQQLLTECQAGDPDGVRLLEAYLDRHFSHWRGSARTEEQNRPDAPSASGSMTGEEALEILGLQPGATPDEIRQAHRTLMKKLHPDQGGSTYFAARVNQAKDVLLDRHRRP
jgi:hypothetical protein